MQITGAGSTFVYPVLSAWAADYKKQTGDKINYQSIGSGGGIAQVKAGTVDFGATDQPLARDELRKSGLAQFPSSIGGIVPVVNIAGVDAGKLQLTGPAARRHLPGQDQDLERSGDREDQSGREAAERGRSPSCIVRTVRARRSTSPTTSARSARRGKRARRRQVGGLAGGVGGKGNEGVAGYVKQIPDSIGYVEYAYVLQNHMAYAPLQNAAGNSSRRARTLRRPRRPAPTGRTRRISTW